ncbi:unnamed protein product, partial [Staurois parvus]
MVGEELCPLKELGSKRDTVYLREWRYGQLKHFVGSLPMPLRKKEDWNPFEHVLDTRGDGKHGITKIYKILTGATRQLFLEKWEMDLEVIIDERKQKKIYSLIHGNVNMKETEMNYKCLVRWYITPNVVHKISGDNSPLCWRGCGERGTMIHLW